MSRRQKTIKRWSTADGVEGAEYTKKRPGVYSSEFRTANERVRVVPVIDGFEVEITGAAPHGGWSPWGRIAGGPFSTRSAAKRAAERHVGFEWKHERAARTRVRRRARSRR